MKVSGFTFIRNAVLLDYPIVASIQSILPLCDEVVVAVGKSEDQTLELIQHIDPKVKIIQTIWDDELRENGSIDRGGSKSNRSRQWLPSKSEATSSRRCRPDLRQFGRQQRSET